MRYWIMSAIAVFLLAVSGCSTTGEKKPRQEVTDEEMKAKIYREAAIEAMEKAAIVRWELTQPILRPVSADKMTVLFRYRNSFGSDVNIESMIITNMLMRGYCIVKTMDEAQYYLNVDIRHISKGKIPDLGTLPAGGISSATPPAPEKSSGLFASAAKKGAKTVANEVTSYDASLVVDVVSGERVPTNVIVRTVNAAATRGSAEIKAQATDQVKSGGAAGSGVVDTQSVTTEDHFIFYANRAVAIISIQNAKMVFSDIKTIDFQDAKPILQQRIAKAVASALP